MSVEFLTPVGRLVWGNPTKSQIKRDQKTKQPVLRDGKQVEQWAFGLAIPKPEFNAQIWPLLYQEMAAVFPNGAPQNFSWKFKDGDGVDASGKRYADREGYAGCFVLTISTEAFAPPVYKFENGVYRQVQPNETKTGDYFVVKLIAKFNEARSPNTPGLYINPQGLELVGFGKEIISQADPNEMFGGRQYNLPPGATATPQAPVTGAAPPYGAPMGNPAPHYMTATPPAGVPMTAPPQVAPVTAYPSNLPPPAHDFVVNAGVQHAAPGNVAYPGTAPPLPAAVQTGQTAPNNAYPSNVPPMPGMPQGR